MNAGKEPNSSAGSFSRQQASLVRAIIPIFYWGGLSLLAIAIIAILIIKFS